MIFTRIIWDDGEITVCGMGWPGIEHGAPPPDWVEQGGAPVQDRRTRRRLKPEPVQE